MHQKKSRETDKSNVIKNLCSRMNIQFSTSFDSYATATYRVMKWWTFENEKKRERVKKSETMPFDIVLLQKKCTNQIRIMCKYERDVMGSCVIYGIYFAGRPSKQTR